MFLLLIFQIKHVYLSMPKMILSAVMGSKKVMSSVMMGIQKIEMDVIISVKMKLLKSFLA